jgi:site-specific DNA recombinase
VQQILDKNKLEASRRNESPEDTLCRSGIAICGYCKSNLAVQRARTKHCISYACYKHKQGYNECRGVVVRSYIVDEIAWEKAVEVIRNPCLIEKEIERQRIEDPTKGSLKAAEELLSKTVTAIINLTQSLETTTEPLTRGILLARLEELAKLKVGYEDQYDQILRFRINWEDAMRALDDFKAWCSKIRPSLDDPEFVPDYKRKRDALEMIGVRVIVFAAGTNPRFTVEVSPPNIMSKFRVIVSKSASAF